VLAHRGRRAVDREQDRPPPGRRGLHGVEEAPGDGGEGLHRVGAVDVHRQDGGQLAERALPLPFEQRAQDVVGVPEQAVHHRAGHPGGPGHRVDRHPRDPAGVDQVERGVQELLPALLGGHPGRVGPPARPPRVDHEPDRTL
jgi:hypothetical protein